MLKKLINRFKRKYIREEVNEININGLSKSTLNDLAKAEAEVFKSTGISEEKLKDKKQFKLEENTKELRKALNKIKHIRDTTKKYRIVKKQNKRIMRKIVHNTHKTSVDNSKCIYVKRFLNNKKVYEKEQRRKEREKAKNEQNKNRS